MMFSETACSMKKFGAMKHRRTRNDVFRDRVLHEEIRRDDRHLATRQRFIVEHAARATPMVGMGVGEDHGRDRALAAVLEVQLHRGPRALDRGQRIHHDHALVAFDQGHVGDVEPAHLIDAGHHLEQAVVHVEARLPPKARVDRRRRLLSREEAVGFQRPDHAPLRVRDPCVFDGAEKTAFGVVEVARVRKRQRLQRRRMLRDDRGGCLPGSLLGRFRRRCLGHTRSLPRITKT